MNDIRQQLHKIMDNDYFDVDRAINEIVALVEAHTRQACLETAKFVEEQLRTAPKDSWYGTLSEAIEALQHPGGKDE